jgi:predicted transcriptional regulator
MAIQAWHIMREKFSVRPDTSAQEVAHKIISSGLPAIPVVNESLEVLGMATEHAILGAIEQGLDPEHVTAASIMVKTPITADITTSPDDLIRMMQANNCCSVITIMNNGKYAGIVSRHMLMDIYTSPNFPRFAQKDRKGPFLCL